MLEEALNHGSTMYLEVVPDQDDIAREVAEQVPEEEDQPLGLDIEVRGKGKVKSYTSTAAGHREGGDNRDLLPVASLLIEDGSSSAVCPGPPHQRGEQQAALIEEDEMCVQARCVFLPAASRP